MSTRDESCSACGGRLRWVEDQWYCRRCGSEFTEETVAGRPAITTPDDLTVGQLVRSRNDGGSLMRISSLGCGNRHCSHGAECVGVRFVDPVLNAKKHEQFRKASTLTIHEETP